MKTRLLNKLRKEARTHLKIRAINTTPSRRQPTIIYEIEFNGVTMKPDTKIIGGWAQGYDEKDAYDVQRYRDRLIGRWIECKTTQMRLKRGWRHNKTIKIWHK